MADETDAGVPGADYPKMLYKGAAVDPNGYDCSGLEELTVANADDEASARKNGYVDLREVGGKPAKTAA